VRETKKEQEREIERAKGKRYGSNNRDRYEPPGYGSQVVVVIVYYILKQKFPRKCEHIISSTRISASRRQLTRGRGSLTGTKTEHGLLTATQDDALQ